MKIVDFKHSNLELLVIPVCKDIEIHLNDTISNLLKTAKILADFKAKNGEIVTLFQPPDTSIKRVVFLGLGDLKEVSLESLRSLAGKSVNYSIDLNVKHMTFVLPFFDKIPITDKDIFISFVEGFFLSNYIFNTYKREKNKIPLSEITLGTCNEKYFKFSYLISKIKDICKGTILAREWVNMPSNDKKPNHFAKLIEENANKTEIKISKFDEIWLSKQEFGAMLAVGQGSDSKSCLVTMEYKPVNYKKKILLVGKGVTFDSGGINLKPSIGIGGMKTDMAGAAAVAGTLIAISNLKLENYIIGVIPLVENMPSGNAMCPGDIVRTFSGKTVEISNTDAEGRLILVDALAWGIDKYKPDIVIDIATLTGACAVALGDKIAGVFSKDNNLSRAIIKAGEKTFERCWHMPIPDDYIEFIKSDLADLNNMSSSKWGGAVTASVFLSEFVSEVSWAHIDIAGTARSNKKTDYCNSGATGFGVRLLCELLENL